MGELADDPVGADDEFVHEEIAALEQALLSGPVASTWPGRYHLHIHSRRRLGRCAGAIVTDRPGPRVTRAAGSTPTKTAGAASSSWSTMCDDHTFATLGALEISPEWRCLEIGAGAGSVARWLADRVPQGEVVATDLNIAYLPPGHREPPPARARRADRRVRARLVRPHPCTSSAAAPPQRPRGRARGPSVAQAGRLVRHRRDRRRTESELAPSEPETDRRPAPRDRQQGHRHRQRVLPPGSDASQGGRPHACPRHLPWARHGGRESRTGAC